MVAMSDNVMQIDAKLQVCRDLGHIWKLMKTKCMPSNWSRRAEGETFEKELQPSKG